MSVFVFQQIQLVDRSDTGSFLDKVAQPPLELIEVFIAFGSQHLGAFKVRSIQHTRPRETGRLRAPSKNVASTKILGRLTEPL